MKPEDMEIEYRLRKDGITLHCLNASSRQQIAEIILNKAGAITIRDTLAKLIPLVPDDAKEQKAAPQI